MPRQYWLIKSEPSTYPFEKLVSDGKTTWEIFFDAAGPGVIHQMDTGNTLDGGGDPLALIKKYPGQTKSIHIKEHQEKTFDSDFYKEIFHLCETSSGTKWYIVEMGGPDGNGFEVPRMALEKLRRLGK